MKKRLIAAAVGVMAALLVAIPGIASQSDGNADGLPDRWEKRHDLSLQVKQGKRNQDGDALRNRGEFKQGTDPRDPDTDDDGVVDGEDSEPGKCEGKPHRRPPPAPEEEPAE
jgi:hypothetical protein